MKETDMKSKNGEKERGTMNVYGHTAKVDVPGLSNAVTPRSDENTASFMVFADIGWCGNLIISTDRQTDRRQSERREEMKTMRGREETG
jgi:hypothetical protein